ncbi:MAG: NADH-quinone oxidoreductase subunit N [Elusimicrobia bacterium]|nr:NADH-quinone oxidoreductase subunit N [Candidatus Obscuribacterium magneticum]
MKDLVLILPEIFVFFVGCVVLLGEAFFPRKSRLWLPVSIAGLVCVALFLFPFFSTQSYWGVHFDESLKTSVAGIGAYQGFFGMVIVDSQAVFFKLASVFSTLLVLLLSKDHWEFETIQWGTYSSLLLFATVGMMFLVSSNDLLMAVLSLELLGIASFILTGFVLSRRSSSEGAIKFFLVGTLSTGLFLFGISYYYGYFGSTNLKALLELSINQGKPDFVLGAALVFLVAGLGFKLAMVPFHMWVPDSYEGAPTPVTAFLSVAPKVAAIGFLVRLFGQHASLNLTWLFSLLAALTMTVGNLGALQQTNVKRLLAYSSIAQMGYILAAFVAGGGLGSQAVMVYLIIYIFMNIGLFSLLILLSNQFRSDEIEIFSGLSRRSIGLGLALVVFLLSMTGVPPLAGFVGKFVIFAALIKDPALLWLAVVAVINSVISLFYYFRIAHQAFFKSPTVGDLPLTLNPYVGTCFWVTLLMTIAWGLFPSSVLVWIGRVVGLI